MVRFKAVINFDQEVKKSNNTYIRLGFFVFFIIFILVLSFEALTPLNPLNGFLLVWFPLNLLYLIAFVILIIIVFLSLFVYRPFCRYICPFGLIASLIGRFSIIKIRRTESCLDCGLCEKICPTLEGFRKSKKGECYLCYRCMDFCKNEMFIDHMKLAEIHRHLIAFNLSNTDNQNEEFFDKVLKRVIRLFIPYKRIKSFDKFIEALESKHEFSTEAVQNIVTQLSSMFPSEISKINRLKYKEWIKQNESKWKNRLDSYQKDKLHFRLIKEK